MSDRVPHTIVIADDHPVVLGGLKSLIDADARFSVMGSAANGILALEAIRRFRPDIAVLDLHMPGLTGIEVLAAMQQDGLPTRGVLLAAAASDAELYDAVAARAVGMILKEAAPETLMDCLRKVADGGLWMPFELLDAAIARETARRNKWERLSPLLTAREAEIVQLLAAGSSNKDIAFRLHVSDGTAKVHLNNVFHKLQVSSRAELLRLASGQVAASGHNASRPKET